MKYLSLLLTVSLFSLNAVAGNILRVKLTCRSENHGRTKCDSPVIIKNIKVAKRLSDAKCTFKESWNYNARTVTVDEGCYAQFEITPAYKDIECYTSGGNWGYKECYVGFNIFNIQHISSKGHCLKNKTYGFSDDYVWIDNMNKKRHCDLTRLRVYKANINYSP
ncbi:MAG: DUF3011 domain-containing protein [Candidatus Poribacteria bacterium]